MSNDHPVATGTDFSFVRTLLAYGEDYRPQPRDVLSLEYSDLTPIKGSAVPKGSATVVSVGKKSIVLASKSGKTFEVEKTGFFHVDESPAIREALAKGHVQAIPDGVAFSDSCVPAALRTRLRKRVTQLAAQEPVDHHPGSGTRVRDLVHPSLYPYVEGVSKVAGAQPEKPAKTEAKKPKKATASSKAPPAPAPTAPALDRFGRPFESSRYQWLPTPFRIAKDGTTTIDGYINNLDAETYAPLYGDLAALFSSVLPMIESVVDYVDRTRFWQNGEKSPTSEADLPGLPAGKGKKTAKEPKPKKRSLRGRELQVIPKIVEYRLGKGETHEGVWHVEGMSHEHIVATCVFVLDRDASLAGGDLSFKRPYTLEEAGRLFWNAEQIRPQVIDTVVNEGTVPLGSVATPSGRVVVFPNSHIHKLEALTVAPRAKEAHRRVIVFWVVDPDVTIPSTREVAPQQGVIKRKDALKYRLALMEERRLHKTSFNLRSVSLCEH